jgi:flagellar assembly factor FliW
MNIDTTRLGRIEARESDLISMKGTILGFEHLSRFLLLLHDAKTPFMWLQSVDEASIAFVVINPRIVKPDYNPIFFESDLKFLDIKNSNDIAMLSIATVRPNPFRITVNLRAPLLINAATRTGAQVVLEDDPEYPIQYDIRDNRTVLNRGFPPECGEMGELAKLSPLALTTT